MKAVEIVKMSGDKEGEFVSYEDYKLLEEENNKLKEELQSISSHIDNCISILDSF